MLLTKRQESELITSIKGRGEIPLKFQYLGEGAHNWDKIAQLRSKKDRGIQNMESDLLKKRVSNFLDTFQNIRKLNVIDLGCGNGCPVFPILEWLNKRKIPYRYVPVDISKEMLELAIRNVRSKYKVECKPVQLDFELGHFSDMIYGLKEDGSSNLMLFLGSTLGNHSDRHRVLTNFRDSMTSEDFLLIGVEVTNIFKIHKILPQYKGKLHENFLYFIPEKIGIKRTQTKFDVSWNEAKQQVELRIILEEDQIIKIGKEKFTLEKNEQVLLARSVKFNEWSFTKLLSEVGFRTELLTTTPDRGYILAMVQPTRYSI